MPTAVIVDAVRTAGASATASCPDGTPADLAGRDAVGPGHPHRTSIPRSSTTSIMGCVMQAGAQSVNVGRNAVLAAGWPEACPPPTVDRQCGSSQQAPTSRPQAVHQPATADVVVAAGVEVMSQVADGRLHRHGKFGFPFGSRVNQRYGDVGRPRPPGHLLPRLIGRTSGA
jgi:acetyl-CoA acetyltransferase